MGNDLSERSGSTGFVKWSLQAIKPAMRLLARPQALAQFPRLFTEGLGPVRRLFIQAHNQKELNRLVRSGAQVNFISSFARSGNTWTRNLLADALLQAQGFETTTELPISFTEVVPDYYCDLISKRNPAIKISGTLVKTHDSFELLGERILGRSGAKSEVNHTAQAFRNCKFLYLFRSPEDVLVSYFHLQRKVDYVAKSRFGIDEYCRSQLPHWMDNLASYLHAAEAGTNVYFVPYEGMLQDPTGSLAGVLRWLEIPHDVRMVERAVSNMEFDKIRAREDRNRPGVSEYSLRRGGSGAALEELQPQTRCEIREATAQLLKQANKRVARQASLLAAMSVKPIGDTAVARKNAKSLQPSAGLQPI